MTYNYLRFENPLEFGIGYTLTIYDYTHIDMHLSLIMISIVNFLFAVPIINTTFPFIHGNFDNLNTNGYYFIATYTTLGVIPTTLPILSLLYSPKIAKNFNLKEKVKIFFIWFLPGIVFPIILVAMTWEYGYAIRYNADFAWQLSFAAFAVIYYVYNRLNNKPVKKWLYRVFFAATVWCVISNLSGIFSTDPIEHIYHNVSGAYDYYKIRNLFMFWN